MLLRDGLLCFEATDRQPFFCLPCFKHNKLMKAIQLKAPASLGIAMNAKSVAKTVSNNAMGLAVTFGTASFIGSLLDAIPFASISALLMVGSLYPLNAKKGGSEC